MKKLIITVAVFMMALNLFPITIMTQETYKKTWIPPSDYEQHTEYYEFRFVLKTPYGVILKDDEGNVVLDEKNSPVIVFHEVSMQWRAVLRVQNWKDNQKMEWAVLAIPDDKDVIADGTGGIRWKEAKGVSMVDVVMESGDIRAYYTIPFTTPERGEGLGSATCVLTGSAAMAVQHNKLVITTGSGSITGYGLDEARALGMAEPATPLVPTPVEHLSVYGSASIYRRGGEMNYKQIRNILKVKTSVKEIYR